MSSGLCYHRQFVKAAVWFPQPCTHFAQRNLYTTKAIANFIHLKRHMMESSLNMGQSIINRNSWFEQREAPTHRMRCSLDNVFMVDMLLFTLSAIIFWMFSSFLQSSDTLATLFFLSLSATSSPSSLSFKDFLSHLSALNLKEVITTFLLSVLWKSPVSPSMVRQRVLAETGSFISTTQQQSSSTIKQFYGCWGVICIPKQFKSTGPVHNITGRSSALPPLRVPVLPSGERNTECCNRGAGCRPLTVPGVA